MLPVSAVSVVTKGIAPLCGLHTSRHLFQTGRHKSSLLRFQTPRPQDRPTPSTPGPAGTWETVHHIRWEMLEVA